MTSDTVDGSGFDMPLSPREKVSFWRDERFADMECMSATFHTLQFSPHSHDTFGIGAMEAGLQKYRIQGTAHTAGAGDLYLINPEDVHEGRPVDEGYRYRIIYPSVALMREMLEDITGKPLSGTPSFSVAAASAPGFAREFVSLHKQLEMGADRLESEARFIDFLKRLMMVYGAEKPAPKEVAAGKPVHIARDFMEAHFSDDISLADIAAEAGLSRAHLVRAFTRAFYVSPHAWLTNRRIREAKSMLKTGMSIADTAFECGFADQPHLTRHFKARTGVTPAVYRDRLGIRDVA
ncbi:AraC family transcriptional regulator [Rhizobium sp. L1K21]|uniref:AraC family transcriptional regulator n=1 Tax=Rhizobium sp. L1K21 TaxID=2954933 RepID=UPI0020934686|nr:AraC family transcriptional regulator [Rhizobium sp. L1K21]MCO6186545.1 AraC family transcriptional regulator [Rhizobium sp. L1K21]